MWPSEGFRQRAVLTSASLQWDISRQMITTTIKYLCDTESSWWIMACRHQSGLISLENDVLVSLLCVMKCVSLCCYSKATELPVTQLSASRTKCSHSLQTHVLCLKVHNIFYFLGMWIGAWLWGQFANVDFACRIVNDEACVIIHNVKKETWLSCSFCFWDL